MAPSDLACAAQLVQAADGECGFAVPVAVEIGLRLGKAVADRKDIDVMEIGSRRGVEIFIPDVAATGDEHPAIGQPALVVHAPRGGEILEDEFEAAAEGVGAAAAGVEQADLDVGVAVERQQ